MTSVRTTGVGISGSVTDPGHTIKLASVCDTGGEYRSNASKSNGSQRKAPPKKKAKKKEHENERY